MNYTVFQWFNNFADSSKLLDTLMIAITNSAAYVAVLFMFILWFNNGKKRQLENNIQFYIRRFRLLLHY